MFFVHRYIGVCFVMQFKQDMANDIVSGVLRGLEGAVITSVAGTSGLGPAAAGAPQASCDGSPAEASRATGETTGPSGQNVTLNSFGCEVASRKVKTLTLFL